MKTELLRLADEILTDAFCESGYRRAKASELLRALAAQPCAPYNQTVAWLRRVAADCESIEHDGVESTIIKTCSGFVSDYLTDAANRIERGLSANELRTALDRLANAVFQTKKYDIALRLRELSRTILYAAQPAAQVVTDATAVLMRFYDVETTQGLIDAQAEHITKLQARLKEERDRWPQRDNFPRPPRGA